MDPQFCAEHISHYNKAELQDRKSYINARLQIKENNFFVWHEDVIMIGSNICCRTCAL